MSSKLLKKIELTAEFTSFPKESNWVNGKCGAYIFEAKLFDTGSSFGIRNGRVSKLCIWIPGENGKHDWKVNYDRGWDIRPTEDVKPAYKAIMKLLENAPKRFDNE